MLSVVAVRQDPGPVVAAGVSVVVPAVPRPGVAAAVASALAQTTAPHEVAARAVRQGRPCLAAWAAFLLPLAVPGPALRAVVRLAQRAAARSTTER
jgi:hypothetical protein